MIESVKRFCPARFRLSPPPQIEIGHDYIVEHIARHSYRAVEGGWSLKYDPAQLATLTLSLDIKDRLAGLRCRAAAIYAEQVMGFKTQDTIMLILLVNITAAVGALGFGYVQDRIGKVPALRLTIVGWILMTVVAFFSTAFFSTAFFSTA